MFLIRWLLILNSIIPALILFPVKKIFLRKDKKAKYKGPVITSLRLGNLKKRFDQVPRS